MVSRRLGGRLRPSYMHSPIPPLNLVSFVSCWEQPNQPTSSVLKKWPRMVSPKDRGTLNGLVQAGTVTGALITPPLVVWLSFHYGWRAAFVATGLPACSGWPSGLPGMICPSVIRASAPRNCN